MAERQRGEKLNKEQRERLQQEAWIMRQRGETQETIADTLGIDQTTVSRMLRMVSTRLARQFQGKADAMLAEQVAQLDYIIGRALSAFRTATNAETGKTGDARLLQAATAALAQKAKLLGTEAPKKTEISGPGGKPVEISDSTVRAAAEKELHEWRKQQIDELAQLNLQSVPPT